MPNEWTQWWNRIKEWWAKLEANRRLALLLTATLTGALLAAGIWWATRPDFAPLYSQLSASDAGAVLEHLKEKKVPYRLEAGGTRVDVPSAQVYDLRLALAGKGLPHGQGVGFEIFDKMSFGVTDEVQRINYVRALQTELEKTIDALAAIEASRVHLVMPREELWSEEAEAPSASVLVKLASGSTLTRSQVDSIRHLLASAIRGLSPERVTLVDTQGNVLAAAGSLAGASGLNEKQMEFKQKTEAYLREQAETLLTEILGPHRAAVRIHAEVDFDQVVTEREYYAPVVGNKGLVRSEKQNSLSPVQEGGGAGGPAGSASNLQGYPPSGQGGMLGSSKNERVLNYEMNRTVERVSTASGTIKQLSVGVFVDGEIPAARLTDIQTVLSRALGIHPERGDQIEVKAMPFQRDTLEAERTLLEKSQRQKFWLTLLTTWAPRALLVVAALGFLLAGNRQLKKYSLVADLPGNGRAGNGSGNGNGNGNGNMDTEAVLALIRKNPSQTADVLKQWIS